MDRGDWIVTLGIVALVAIIYLLVGRGGRRVLEERALGRALAAKARDVMSRPVVAAREDTPLEEAAGLMLDRGIRSLPVVGPDGRLVGIVTESDVTGRRPSLSLRSLRGQPAVGDRVREEGADSAYEEWRTKRVGEVMSKRVVTAAENDTVTEVATRMIDNDLHHVPVVRDGVPVGVVARHDLLRLMAPGRRRS